jgi:hypothetical protein
MVAGGGDSGGASDGRRGRRRRGRRWSRRRPVEVQEVARIESDRTCSWQGSLFNTVPALLLALYTGHFFTLQYVTKGKFKVRVVQEPRTGNSVTLIINS